MKRKCPICRQPLPTAITDNDLEEQINKLNKSMLADESARLKHQLNANFKKRLQKQAADLRAEALRKARNAIKKEHLELKQKEAAAQRDLSKIRREMDVSLKREKRTLETMAKRRLKSELEKAEKLAERQEQRLLKMAQKDHEQRLKKAEQTRQKELLRHKLENSRLAKQVDDLSHRLEKVSSEQRGEEAELDFYSGLKSEFPDDRIKRIGKGVRGADIVQHVIVNQEEVGRIVYESKNVSTWQNVFITKAKRYQKQYNTPYVMIVTRTFPRKAKGMAVVKDILIAEPMLALHLARVIRDGIVEVSRYRVSQEGRRAKEHKLFEYIIGDEFRSSFKEIANSIAELRAQEQKERDWHENAWQERSGSVDRIDACRRGITSKIKTTIEEKRQGKLKVVR